MVQKMT